VTASTDTARYGSAEASAWPRMHQRLARQRQWKDHPGPLPVIDGTLIRLAVDRLPGDRSPEPLWLWTMITVNRRSPLRNAAGPSAGLVIASRVRVVADGHGVEQRRAPDEVAPDEEALCANMLYSATGRPDRGRGRGARSLSRSAPPCCPVGPGGQGVWGDGQSPHARGVPGGRPPGQQSGLRATCECALSRLPADDEDRPLVDDIAAAGQVIAVLADG
jgi:hypothetical protein